MNDINYSAIVSKLFPNAVIDDDYEFSSDGHSIFISKWNKEKLGDQPSIDFLTDNWLIVAKDLKIAEIKQKTQDEIDLGISGYMTRGLKNNFKISSSRYDLNNIQNMFSFMQSAIISFDNASYEPHCGDRIYTNNGWNGIITSFIITDQTVGSMQGSAHFQSCSGEIIVGEQAFITLNGEKTPIATVKEITKNNVNQILFRDYDNNFHQINVTDLEILISELQSYGLWLYQHKWELEQLINSTTDLVQLENISW